MGMGFLKMKRKLNIIFVIVLSFFLVSCNPKYGDTSNVEVIKIESNTFTENDINDGIDAVFKYFKKEYKGCELLNIKYVGDAENTYDDWAKRNNKEESIAFISDFIVHDNSKVQSLNEDTYTGWNWILVRNKGENWILVDNGY